MYTTAFSQIINLPEDILSNLYVNLFKHQLIYKHRVVFSDGHFVANISALTADMLNSCPLLSTSSKLRQDEWLHVIQACYTTYSSEGIMTHKVPLNFRPEVNYKNNAGLSYTNFNKARLTLDLFILFGYTLNRFIWNNLSHYCEVVCEGCVLYREWMVNPNSSTDQDITDLFSTNKR